MAGNLIGLTDLTGLRVGNSNTPQGQNIAGSAITWIGWASASVSAFSALGNQTSSATVAFSNVTPGDVVICEMRSALSNSVALANSYVTAPGIMALIFSNASSTTLSQSAVTVDMIAFRASNATAL